MVDIARPENHTLAALENASGALATGIVRLAAFAKAARELAEEWQTFESAPHHSQEYANAEEVSRNNDGSDLQILLEKYGLWT